MALVLRNDLRGQAKKGKLKIPKERAFPVQELQTNTVTIAKGLEKGLRSEVWIIINAFQQGKRGEREKKRSYHVVIG